MFSTRLLLIAAIIFSSIETVHSLMVLTYNLGILHEAHLMPQDAARYLLRAGNADLYILTEAGYDEAPPAERPNYILGGTNYLIELTQEMTNSVHIDYKYVWDGGVERPHLDEETGEVTTHTETGVAIIHNPDNVKVSRHELITWWGDLPSRRYRNELERHPIRHIHIDAEDVSTNEEFAVLGVHLQATTHKKEMLGTGVQHQIQETREVQFKTILTWIKAVIREKQFIIAGDMNIKQEDHHIVPQWFTDERVSPPIISWFGVDCIMLSHQYNDKTMHPGIIPIAGAQHQALYVTVSSATETSTISQQSATSASSTQSAPQSPPGTATETEEALPAGTGTAAVTAEHSAAYEPWYNYYHTNIDDNKRVAKQRKHLLMDNDGYNKDYLSVLLMMVGIILLSCLGCLCCSLICWTFGYFTALNIHRNQSPNDPKYHVQIDVEETNI